MAGGALARWWSKMGPYYIKATPEIFVGMGIMGVLYYRLSSGGKKKAVDSKPAH